MSQPNRRRQGGYALGLLPLVALVAFVAAACHGGDHLDMVVNRTADGSDAVPGDGVCEVTPGEGDCSLRAAVDEANAAPPDSYPVATLVAYDDNPYLVGGAADDDANASGDLDLTVELTVQADGPGAVIRGGGEDRVFDVWGRLSLIGVTVEGGNAVGGFGGAAQVNGGATAVIIGTTLTGNEADVGGAVATAGTTDIVLSTISGNAALAGGGGVAVATGTTVNVRNSTITDNTNGGISTAGTTNLYSTVVADQRSGVDCGFNSPVSGGHNLDSDGTCLPAPAAGDLASATASLAPLTDRGGYTPTHLPRLSSDALDAGDPASTVTVDQRAVPTPQGTAADIGATEAMVAELGGPSAVDDDGAGFATDEDTVVTTGDVRANDTDPTLDVLTVTGFDTTGTLGSVTDNGDGTFTYDPGSAFQGMQDGDSATDSFTYTVSDGDGLTDVAVVTIEVTGVGDAPVATGETYENGIGNTPYAVGREPLGAPIAAAVRVSGSVLDNDVDGDDATGLTAILDSPPSSGSLTWFTDGTFVYDPPPGVRNASRSFTYRVVDPAGHLSAPATVTIDIGARAVWYVASGAPGSDAGTATNPHRTLAPVNGAGGAGDADLTGDTIYVARGNGVDQTANLVLEDQQGLVGQAAGLSLPDVGEIVAPVAGRPKITNVAAGTALTLANTNTVSDLDLAATGGTGVVITGRTADSSLERVGVTTTAGGTGISQTANSNTTITLDDVDVSSAGGPAFFGQAGGWTSFTSASSLSATNAAAIVGTGSLFSGTLGSATSTNSSTGGIDVNNIAPGALTISTTTVTGGTGTPALRVQGTGNVNLGTTSVTTANAGGVEVASRGSATTTFASLDVNATGGTGFSANHGGIVTISSATTDVRATNGPALAITNTSNGGPSGWQFDELVSTSSFNNGITLYGLAHTFTAASVTVTGPSYRGLELQNGSGAVTITKASVTNPGAEALYLRNNTGSVTVSGGSFTSPGANNSDDDGVLVDTNPGSLSISGTLASPFLISGFADNTSTSLDAGRSGVRSVKSGDLTLSRVHVTAIGRAGGSDAEHGVAVLQPADNTDVRVEHSTIDGLLDGDGDGIYVQNDPAASPSPSTTGMLRLDVLSTTVDGSGTFSDIHAGVNVQIGSGATFTGVVWGSTLTDLTAPVIGRIEGVQPGRSSLELRNNTIRNFAVDGVSFDAGNATGPASYVRLVMDGNAIDGDHGVGAATKPSASQGISLRNNGDGYLSATLTDNSVTDVADEALLFVAPTGSTAATQLALTGNTFTTSLTKTGVHLRNRGSGRLDVVASGNTSAAHVAGDAFWIRSEVGTNDICADIRGTTTGGPAGGTGIRLSRNTGTFALGSPTATYTAAQAEAFVADNNPQNTLGVVAEANGGTFVGSSCLYAS